MLNPTFVAFTPWTSLEGYVGPSAIWDLDLVANVSPVQYGIRLLIAEGSRLLELEEVQDVVGDFDEAALCWTWAHEDPRVDRLSRCKSAPRFPISPSPGTAERSPPRSS